jgi:hypothetical protein
MPAMRRFALRFSGEAAMIKADTINEYLFCEQQRKNFDRQARDMKARQEQLEAEMIEALEANQRVEKCGYKLAVETFIKRFYPSYKTCAIDLSSESLVIQWVDENDPKEEGKRLVVAIDRKKEKAA